MGYLYTTRSPRLLHFSGGDARRCQSPPPRAITDPPCIHAVCIVVPVCLNSHGCNFVHNFTQLGCKLFIGPFLAPLGPRVPGITFFTQCRPAFLVQDFGEGSWTKYLCRLEYLFSWYFFFSRIFITFNFSYDFRHFNQISMSVDSDRSRFWNQKSGELQINEKYHLFAAPTFELGHVWSHAPCFAHPSSSKLSVCGREHAHFFLFVSTLFPVCCASLHGFEPILLLWEFDPQRTPPAVHTPRISCYAPTPVSELCK